MAVAIPGITANEGHTVGPAATCGDTPVDATSVRAMENDGVTDYEAVED